ncbi:MAG: hypothetical protein ACI30W_02915 [Muribaculaceae bacterium]
MKKLIFISFMAATLLSSCADNKDREEKEQAQALAAASQEQLAEAVQDRDQLLGLVNDISADMSEIKRLENILTIAGGSETPNQQDQIRADIAALQQALQERRTRLEELEKKLKNSDLTNSKLKQTITNLRAQIDSQASEIEQLKTSLNEANTRIGELNTTVDSLNTTVADVTNAKNEAEQKSEDLANELNTCYYAIGSKSELKSHNIIETGFLRKSKLMKGQFDQKFFTTADKRTLSSISLHSKKAEVLTNHPTDSYELETRGEQKVLVIKNAAKFWSLSNFLVVKID